ncbi:MAG: hypothetical protein RBT76_03815 [candidate division Zixibacteria bacterium]|nr:hypothetical protein [candidate division Zixibacteria bacterium]
MTASRIAVLLVVGLCLCGQQALSACVTLSWTATGDDGAVGTASFYDIRFSRSAITAENWSSATPARVIPNPKPAGAREEWLVSGLEPGVRYYFAIRAADEYRNWSDISNVISRRAPMQVCSGVVGNVDCDPFDDVDLSDVVRLAGYLFLNGQICCPEEANIDGDVLGRVDLSDLLRLVQHLFTPPYQLPACL